MTERDNEHDKIRRLIAELRAAGISPYKLSVILSVSHNTIKHWAETGKVESHDADRLARLHRLHCRKPASYAPQYVVAEDSGRRE